MNKTDSNAQASIRCKVSPGMFSSERGILVELPDGRKVSAFVDKRDVMIDQDPQPGAEVEGLVKVYIVEVKKDSVLVDLPQPGLTDGPRLRIPKTFLR